MSKKQFDEDEIQKIIEEINKQNPDGPQPKIISIKGQNTKTKVLNILMDIVLNLVLFFGISGLFPWMEGTVVEVLVIATIFTLIQTLIKYVVLTFFPKLLYMSFGILNFVISIFSFIVAIIIVSTKIVINVNNAIAFYLIFGIIKLLLKYLFMRIKIKNIFRAWKEVKMIIIFDVDGTLLDTYDLIRQTYIYVFDKFLPEHQYTESEIKSFFGPALEDTFRSVVDDEEKVKFLVNEYHKFNLEYHSKYLKIYPHIKEGLEILKAKGIKLGVVSNKVRSAIVYGFEIMGIINYFDVIVGLDEVVCPKPNPEGINKIRAFFPNEEAIMVGDTVFDILTAKNANIKSVAVTYSMSKKEDFDEINPDYVINDFLDLIKIVEEL